MREFTYTAKLKYPYRLGNRPYWRVRLYTEAGDFVGEDHAETRWGALRWAKKQAKHHAQGGDARIQQDEEVTFKVKVA